MVKKFTTLFLMAIFCVSLSACHKKAGTNGLKEVETGRITKGAIEKTVLFTGNIEAKDAVQVFPRAAGKVSQKLLKEGDAVAKKQAIVMVDRDEIGYKFKPMPVESPIDGFVGTISVDVGTLVDVAQPLAIVVRPGNMRVKLDVPERYLPDINLGTKVTMVVDTLGDEKFEGEIITSSPVVDEKTRTARVEIAVPNPDNKLRHGMFGRIHLVVEKIDDTIIAPYSAISWEGEDQYVYKIVNNKVERKQVRVGLRNEMHVEVSEGLAEGDLVAVSGLIDLKENEEVKTK